MKQQILDLMNTLPEEEQNLLMEELRTALKQQRISKIFKVEEEARRIEWTLKGL
jgi:hypothetical protein